jgi:hypothetical protein
MTTKKPFLITIDTEGDNLWGRAAGAATVRNAEYLPRFQALCEQFGFRPTYLTNWEMARAPAFIDMARAALARGTAEVGCHIHAWDSPPYVDLTGNDCKHHPYLIEYPDAVLREKVQVQTALLEDTFGVKMQSHRAGRWAMDLRYVAALLEHGYTVDCSVTPGHSWHMHKGKPDGQGGTDYRRFPRRPYYISAHDLAAPAASGLLEVPMTTRTSWLQRHAPAAYQLPLLRKVAHRIAPPMQWLRPGRGNLPALLKLIRAEADAPYLEFMIHSSEFMPGGSPYFPGEADVDTLFADLAVLFEAIATTHAGCTMAAFAQSWAQQAAGATVPSPVAYATSVQ